MTRKRLSRKIPRKDKNEYNMSLSEGLENKDALKDPSTVILNDDQKISQNNQEPRKEVCKVQAIPQIGQQTSASFTDFKSDDCLSYGTTVNSTFSILEFNQREILNEFTKYITDSQGLQILT